MEAHALKIWSKETSRRWEVKDDTSSHQAFIRAIRNVLSAQMFRKLKKRHPY
jgi:hypothetical protein